MTLCMTVLHFKIDFSGYSTKKFILKNGNVQPPTGLRALDVQYVYLSVQYFKLIIHSYVKTRAVANIISLNGGKRPLLEYEHC